MENLEILKIPGTTLVRDMNSKALVNQDRNGLEDYLKRRNILASQKAEINRMKSDISELKNDIKEIKLLMMKLLDKGSNG